MEPVNLGYPDKNIPIAKPREYLKCLFEKTESFLRRVRWKVYHFLNPSDKATRDTFGFPTTKLPPPVKELDEFENNMLTLVQNIEFNYQSCDFQKRLTKDTTQIKADTKLLVPADKTTNFYRLDSHSYNQLMHT